MRRRAVLLRGLMIPVSGAVFTATGWLMGTRTLSMGPEAPTPEPGSGIGQTRVSCMSECTLECPAGDRYMCYPNHTVYLEQWKACLSMGCGYGWCSFSATPTSMTC